MIPRTVIRDVWLRSGETFHVTPVSDAHLDDSSCDYEALRRVMDERRGLSNHRVLWIGDTANFILPSDLKRSRPSVLPHEIAGQDAYLNKTTEYIINQITKLDVTSDLFSVGNHEDEVVKRSGYDIVSVLAQQFNAARGGYSGAIDYRLHVTADGKPRKGGKSAYIVCTILWHHGAWGGRKAKGYLGAIDYFSQHSFPWQFAVYGHCHGSRVDPETALIRNQDGSFKEITRYLVNCAGFQIPYPEDSERTTYAERRGYLRSPHHAPLIRVTPRYVGKRPAAGSTLTMDYSVEI